MVEMPEQDYRSVDELMTRTWITSGKQLYVLYCRAKVWMLSSRSGVQWIDHRSGSPVPRSDCIGDIPGYVEGASEWGVDLTMGFKLAWIAVVPNS